MNRFRLFTTLPLLLGSFWMLTYCVEAQPVNRANLPGISDRRETGKLADDNQRIQQVVEKDREAAGSKAKREAIVREAFKRIQILHNEMMTIVQTSPVDEGLALKAITEVGVRADELRTNLALPKARGEKGVKPAVEVIQGSTSDKLTQLSALIRSFVENVNKSPKEEKAGLQARRDLDDLVLISQKVTGPAAPKN